MTFVAYTSCTDVELSENSFFFVVDSPLIPNQISAVVKH